MRCTHRRNMHWKKETPIYDFFPVGVSRLVMPRGQANDIWVCHRGPICPRGQRTFASEETWRKINQPEKSYGGLTNDNEGLAWPQGILLFHWMLPSTLICFKYWCIAVLLVTAALEMDSDLFSCWLIKAKNYFILPTFMPGGFASWNFIARPSTRS